MSCADVAKSYLKEMRELTSLAQGDVAKAEGRGRIAAAETLLTVFAALPACGWMDIETADRDSEYRCLIAYRAAGGPRTTEAERVRGGWNTRNGAGFLCDGSPDLLGWMPLPTPPKDGPGT